MKKKLFKRATSAFLIATMVLSLAGCGKKKLENEEAALTSFDVSALSTSQYDNSFLNESDYVDPDTPEAKKEQAAFDEYLDQLFEKNVKEDSITFHYTIAHPHEYGIEPPAATYGDIDMSDEALANSKAREEQALAELESFDYDLLTGDQRFTYDVIWNKAKVGLEFYDYIYLYEPFAYTSGMQSNFPITLAEYKFYAKEDVDTYLSLLEQTPDYFNALLDFEAVKIDKGLFMNEHSASEVIRQCEEYIADPENNLLIATFETKINKLTELSDEEKEDYIKLNKQYVLDYIIPAYQNTIDFFKTHQNDGVNDLGLAHFDNGQEYYKYLLKSKVGTDKTPEEIIAVLDKRIQEVLSEFTTIAMSNGEAYYAYYENSDNIYGDLDPKQTVANFQPLFEDRFPEIPEIDFSVEPVHESLEGIVSPAFYMTPPLDDYNMNYIYTNLNSDGAGASWSTYAHEGIPGHMYQFVYFLSSNPNPIRTIQNFTGYEEGWATYVELMSYDYYDNYDYDVYADFGRLNGELNLLVSARVEIGVNYEGWDVDGTKDYLIKSGLNGDAAEAIFDYVVAEPANYQMYVFGWQEFESLKAFAQAELGAKFDEKEFHRAILDAGPCQFFVLKQKVEQYIRDNM